MHKRTTTKVVDVVVRGIDIEGEMTIYQAWTIQLREDQDVNRPWIAGRTLPVEGPEDELRTSGLTTILELIGEEIGRQEF